VAVVPSETKPGLRTRSLRQQVVCVVVVLVRVVHLPGHLAVHSATQFETALEAPRATATHPQDEHTDFWSPTHDVVATVVFQRPPLAPRTLLGICHFFVGLQ